MKVKCTMKGCDISWDPVRDPGRYHQHAAKENKAPAVIPDVTYFLVARDPLLAHAFASHFKDQAPFEGMSRTKVIHGDIFAQGGGADAMVSPANSFGQMDGGLDLAILEFFGKGLQDRVYDVYRRFGRTVPVGQAVIIPTSDSRCPYLISAPTMYAPMNVEDTFNAYWAMKAVLQAVHEWNLEDVYMGSAFVPIKQQPIRSVLVPGLCTGTGRMHPDTAARQMRKAYVEQELRGSGL